MSAESNTEAQKEELPEEIYDEPGARDSDVPEEVYDLIPEASSAASAAIAEEPEEIYEDHNEPENFYDDIPGPPLPPRPNEEAAQAQERAKHSELENGEMYQDTITSEEPAEIYENSVAEAEAIPAPQAVAVNNEAPVTEAAPAPQTASAQQPPIQNGKQNGTADDDFELEFHEAFRGKGKKAGIDVWRVEVGILTASYRFNIYQFLIAKQTS